MPGLRRTDDRTFVGAFQGIDRAIINPWFMVCFFGALVLSGAAALLSLRNGFAWLAAAFVLYLVTIVITMAIHVPVNDAMKAAGDPGSIADLAAVRQHFNEARWATWNVVRTVTAAISFVLLVIATLRRQG
jgi:uncharacterized membrane protein